MSEQQKDFDLSIEPSPLQLECERLRQDSEIGKEMLGRMMAEFAHLKQQRDELLTALVAIEEGCSFPSDAVQRAVRDRSRAAIANIKDKT